MPFNLNIVNVWAKEIYFQYMTKWLNLNLNKQKEIWMKFCFTHLTSLPGIHWKKISLFPSFWKHGKLFSFVCMCVCVRGEWMIPGEHGQSNQLSRAHMSSQNWSSRHRSVPGPHVYVTGVSLVSLWDSWQQERVVSDSFACF